MSYELNEALTYVVDALVNQVVPAPAGMYATFNETGGVGPDSWVEVPIIGYRDGQAVVDDGHGHLIPLTEHSYATREGWRMGRVGFTPCE